MTNFDREIIEYSEINEFDQYVDKECTFDTRGLGIPDDELIYDKPNSYYYLYQSIFDNQVRLSEPFRGPNFSLLFNKHI